MALKRKFEYILSVNFFLLIYAMANAEAQDPINDVMQLLEASPDRSTPLEVPLVSSNDVPAQREKLAVLVSTGKSKEAIGVQ